MSERDIHLLLEDILLSAKRIKQYMQDIDLDLFLSDEKTQDAVVRNFGIIGEAANQIDPDFRDGHPEIEWKRIRGFRNRVVHEYFGIDYEVVWEIIREYLDELIYSLEGLIEKHGKS